MTSDPQRLLPHLEDGFKKIVNYAALSNLSIHYT